MCECVGERVRGDGGEQAKKKIWNNGWKLPKLKERYKPTDPRSSMSPKYKKHEENHIEVHNNQIPQNQW